MIYDTNRRVVNFMITIVLILAGGFSSAEAWETVNCGDTIGPCGRYALTSDLSCAGYDIVLRVVGPVELDLNGNTISG